MASSPMSLYQIICLHIVLRSVSVLLSSYSLLFYVYLILTSGQQQNRQSGKKPSHYSSPRVSMYFNIRRSKILIYYVQSI